jgi:hypothetical protein
VISTPPPETLKVTPPTVIWAPPLVTSKVSPPNSLQTRSSAKAGVSELHLVNKAMMAELRALRATRAADAAEMDVILGELRPILQQEA